MKFKEFLMQELMEAHHIYNWEGLGDWESDPDFDARDLKPKDTVEAFNVKLKVDKVFDIEEEDQGDYSLYYFDAQFSVMGPGKIDGVSVKKGDVIRWKEGEKPKVISSDDSEAALSDEVLNVLKRLQVAPENHEKLIVEFDGQKKSLYGGTPWDGKGPSESQIERAKKKIEKFVTSTPSFKVTIKMPGSRGWRTVGHYFVDNGKVKKEFYM